MKLHIYYESHESIFPLNPTTNTTTKRERHSGQSAKLLNVTAFRKIRSSGSSVSTITGYVLDDRGSIPSRCNEENFSLRHRVQTCSEAYPATYPNCAGGPSPEGKATAAWSWPLTSISVDVKNTWSYTSTPRYIFMALSLIKQTSSRCAHRDFTITFRKLIRTEIMLPSSICTLTSLLTQDKVTALQETNTVLFLLITKFWF
jgi:hypothetical protein